MGNRFPFPSFPNGWFVIAFSSDIALGEVKTVHYFDQDIVLFRTVAGKLSALGPTCPHLGAHLGGGEVEGECLRCPFHAWGFDASGRCVDIPYAPKIPPNARARAWHLIEHNGVVMVHYGSAPADDPKWRPEALVEAGWTANRTIRWELDSHPQEVGENTVDCAHLTPVHHVTKTEVLEVEQREHYMRVLLHLVATGHVIGMPDEINDVHLDVSLHGLGQIISNTHVLTAGLRTRQRIHPTPITKDRIAIFAIANTLEMPDPEYTKEIDEIFWQAFTSDFVRDFPIWSKKAYLDRPLLVKGDGPIGAYRKWARQFYVAPVLPTTESTPLTSAEQTATPEPASTTLVPLIDRLVASDRLRAVRGIVGRLRGSLARRPTTNAGTTAPATTDDADEGLPGGGSSQTTADTAPSRKTNKHRFPSVDAYFDTLSARFDPEAAGNLDAVFQWTLTGAQRLDHFAEVRAGKIQTATGVHAAPTITIEMSVDDYLQMINGDLNGALAFSTGRGRLRGPVRLAMRMQRLFPLDRAV